jgi:hypothetical protein
MGEAADLALKRQAVSLYGPSGLDATILDEMCVMVWPDGRVNLDPPAGLTFEEKRKF